MEAVKLIHSLDTCQVEAKDKDNQLPLHVACEVGCSVDVVRYLIKAFPDATHMKNKDGNCPLDIFSRICGYKELIGLLSELSSDVEVAQ